MKDYVFIGWSRNRELAIELKNILDGNGFTCVVGGVYENNPESLRVRKSTVNETINFQMMHCDQSILLFQKIDDNLGISGNLIYELGYISAQYSFIESVTKLHIFKMDITPADDNLFPSDLHGIWGTVISTNNRPVKEIAEEIAAEFLNNQNQIKLKNKFETLSNHYFVEYEMKKHFDAPTMSDCDLATDFLVYVQSAFCYQEQNDIRQKVRQFNNKMVETGYQSRELSFAAEYARITLELFCMTVPTEADEFLLHGKEFRHMLREYEDIAENLSDCMDIFDGISLCEMDVSPIITSDPFESWLISQMQEHITYLILVYLINPQLESIERQKYAALGMKYCKKCINNLEMLSKNDADKLYASILLSYAYKNLSTFCAILNLDSEAVEAKKKSFRLRRSLNNYVNGNLEIKPSLKDYINLEYMMQIIEELHDIDDEYQKGDYILEIEEYIESKRKIENNRNMMFNILIKEFEVVKELK